MAVGDYAIACLGCTEKQLERPGFEAHRNQTQRNLPPGKNIGFHEE